MTLNYQYWNKVVISFADGTLGLHYRYFKLTLSKNLVPLFVAQLFPLSDLIHTPQSQSQSQSQVEHDDHM